MPTENSRGASRPSGRPSSFQADKTLRSFSAFGTFGLDPSLAEMKDKLPGDPFDLVVETFWCHTLDKQAGLEIAEVELIPPVADESE